jgi:hypothetical protein
LRVLAANLYLGHGDVKTLVELVREQRVDVLNLLELTPEAVEEIDHAGLFDLLPCRALRWRDQGDDRRRVHTALGLSEVDAVTIRRAPRAPGRRA